MLFFKVALFSNPSYTISLLHAVTPHIHSTLRTLNTTHTYTTHTGPSMVRWYYEMMGARIGEGVSIHKDAKLGQVDLLHFEDGVAIDNCTIRPFSIEEVSVYCGWCVLCIVVGVVCMVYCSWCSVWKVRKVVENVVLLTCMVVC